MTTIYVRKDEEKVYHALHLDSLTVHDFKLQVGQLRYSIIIWSSAQGCVLIYYSPLMLG